MSKEKEPQKIERNLKKELEKLQGVNSFVSITLVTLDLAIPVSVELLDKFPLGPDDWRKFNSNEITWFAERFKEVMGRPIEEYVKENKDFRPGGAIYITQKTLQELKPEKEGLCIAPTGEGNGGETVIDKLARELTIIRDDLQKRSDFNLDGRLLVSWTASKGTHPFIISLFHEKGRSMVLIKDDQVVKLDMERLSKLKAPHLLLLDARDLTEESYLKEGISLARDPKNFVVLSLGASSIMPQLVGRIKLLHAYTQGEMGFAGNRGEVEALLDNWEGVTNLSELMLKLNLRFLLETNGQNGAILHFRVGEKVHSAAFAIPKEEVFKGDTTNAGDIFLGYVVNGLMDGPNGGESVEDWLYRVLEDASRGTLKKLEERSRLSKENDQGQLSLP